MSEPSSQQPANWTDKHVWQIQAVRDLLFIALVAFILIFGYYLQGVFLPVIISFGLAYLFNPLIRLAERRARMPRPLTVSLVLVMLTLVVMGFFAWFAPLLISQTIRLVNNIPTYVEKSPLPEYIQEFWLQVVDASDPEPPSFIENDDPEAAQPSAEDREARARETLREISEALGFDIENLREEIIVRVQENAGAILQALYAAMRAVVSGTGDVFGFVGGVVGNAVYWIVTLILMPIYFFFFAWKFDNLTAKLVPYLPASQKDRIIHIAGRMDAAVSGFVRGRLTISLILGTIFTVGWWIVGVPYWFLLGALAGLLNIVPFASGLIWPLAILLKYLDMVATGNADHGDLWFWMAVAIWPTVVFQAGQFLDGWVLTPLIESRSSDLSAITIIIVLMCGGAVAGLYGLLLAIPIAACLKILFTEAILPELREWAGKN